MSSPLAWFSGSAFCFSKHCGRAFFPAASIVMIELDLGCAS
jgi:hypothetical protein